MWKFSNLHFFLAASPTADVLVTCADTSWRLHPEAGREDDAQIRARCGTMQADVSAADWPVRLCVQYGCSSAGVSAGHAGCDFPRGFHTHTHIHTNTHIRSFIQQLLLPGSRDYNCLECNNRWIGKHTDLTLTHTQTHAHAHTHTHTHTPHTLGI